MEHQNRREEPSSGVQETENFMPQQTQDAQERGDGTKQQIEDVQEREGGRDRDSIVPQERGIGVQEQLGEARANVRHSHYYIQSTVTAPCTSFLTHRRVTPGHVLPLTS